MGNYLFLALRTLAIVVIVASVWPFFGDDYDGLVARVTTTLLQDGLTLRAVNGRFVLDSTIGGAGFGIHGDVLHFGLVLALALISATPNIGIIKVAAWLGAAAVLFSTLHVVGLAVLFSLVWRALTQEDNTTSFSGAMTGFAIFWALAPGVLAGAWCHRYWLPYLRGRDSIASGERAL